MTVKSVVEPRKEETYSDFTLGFQAHPISGELLRVTDSNSVKQAIRFIVMSGYGDLPYQPTFGGTVRQSLFELDDGFAANDLQFAISQAINNNEPRVKLFDVHVTPKPVQNEFEIRILFAIVGQENVESLNLTLKRAF